jgi:hypothetical protein
LKESNLKLKGKYSMASTNQEEVVENRKNLKSYKNLTAKD